MEHFGLECYRQSTNGDFFESWFEDCILKEVPTGYTVIMDNARFHRKEILRKMARGKVRLLFLPPYSPDYNPIEKTWANMKRYIGNNIQKYDSVESAVYGYFGMSEY
jgi:transposase